MSRSVRFQTVSTGFSVWRGNGALQHSYCGDDALVMKTEEFYTPPPPHTPKEINKKIRYV